MDGHWQSCSSRARVVDSCANPLLPDKSAFIESFSMPPSSMNLCMTCLKRGRVSRDHFASSSCEQYNAWLIRWRCLIEKNSADGSTARPPRSFRSRQGCSVVTTTVMLRKRDRWAKGRTSWQRRDAARKVPWSPSTWSDRIYRRMSVGSFCVPGLIMLAVEDKGRCWLSGKEPSYLILSLAIDNSIRIGLKRRRVGVLVA
jgi:hypothetical protein